jgi:general secretion pathway protein B
MSLILDALKKSEAERQRQTGPTLLEVRVTQPRRRYPIWVIAVGALLAINILLLLIFVLRRPAATAQPAAPLGAGAPAATAPAGTAASAAAPAATSAAAAQTAGGLPASVAPMAASGAEPPLAPAPSAGADPGVLESAADGPAAHNPADDEPAVAAGDAGHYASLPSFSDVGGDLPALRLDLHVYAERPRDRYALINMHRVHEGDVLPEGPRVLAITREGVALDWRGQEFMLHPQ